MRTPYHSTYITHQAYNWHIISSKQHPTTSEQGHVRSMASWVYPTEHIYIMLSCTTQTCNLSIAFTQQTIHIPHSECSICYITPLVNEIINYLASSTLGMDAFTGLLFSPVLVSPGHLVTASGTGPFRPAMLARIASLTAPRLWPSSDQPAARARISKSTASTAPRNYKLFAFRAHLRATAEDHGLSDITRGLHLPKIEKMSAFLTKPSWQNVKKCKVLALSAPILTGWESFVQAR